MRKLATLGLAILGMVGTAKAAPLLTVSATATETATAGVFDVKIFATVTGTATDAFDGGLSGMQFDVLSDGTAKSLPLPNGGGGQAVRAKITWAPAIVGNFSLLTPSKTDAIPAQNPTAVPPYVSDGDLDAVGASFSDASSFSNTTLGLNASALIATEQWQLNAGQSDTLRVHIITPTYYDDTATATGLQRSFLPGQYNTGNITVALGATGTVPEPTSLAFLAVGGLMAARRRRA